MKKLTITGMIYAVAWALLLMPSLVNAQTMTLTPTFESIGIELKIGVNQSSVCDVEYRKTGDSDWEKKGLRLFTDHSSDSDIKGFRGSLVLLDPGTKYDVRLIYSINGESPRKLEKSIQTWSEKFPEAQPIIVSSKEDLANIKSGTATQYTVYDGKNQVTIDGKNERNALLLQGVKYVIIRNMKFKGGRGSAIKILESNHIVIEDCEIFNWGRAGQFCGTPKNGFDQGGKEAGIEVATSSQIVVQHNKIRDPNGNSCNWKSIPDKYLDKEKGESSHPAGPRGIAARQIVRHSVFRYNRVFSNSKDHYFSDIFNGEERGTASDIDVYGNDFSNAWDDGIEIEGENKNIRVWNNAIYRVYHGVASDRNGEKYYGPVYIWRNIITDLNTAPGEYGGRAAFKMENREIRGGVYIFNNTISGLATPQGINRYHEPNDGISNNNQYNFTLKNNIFEIDSRDAYNTNMKPGGDLNYNAYSHSKTSYMTENGWEKNSQFNVKFTYTNPSGWNYYAQDNGNSKAQNRGTRIPNFIETPDGKAPDLGAAQKGVWNMCVGPHADLNCPNKSSNPPTKPNPPTTDPKEPVVVQQASVTAKRANSLEESYWAGVPAYDFTDPAGESDNQVRFKAVWNEQYLVIGVQVIDNDPLALIGEETKLWKNDAVDLLFDPENTNSSNWDTLMGHRQVIVDVAERQYREPTGFAVQAQRTPLVLNNRKASLYEVRIPWGKLANITPQPDLMIGFDLANHDLDPEGIGTKKTQFTYTGRVSDFKTPSLFAQLVLSSAEEAFPVANQWYFLENREYGKRLDTDNCNADGPVDISTTAGTDIDKQWRFVSVGKGYYALENQCSERWLTTTGEQISLQAGSSAAKKTHWKLIAVDANASEAGWYFLRNREEGNHLDADPSGAVDANNPGDNPDKQWRLIPVGQENARTGLAEKTAVVTPGAEVRQLLVYPNPSSEGHAHLQLSGFGEQAQVQIVDAKGQVIYQGVHTESQINLAKRFPGGLYVVRVSDARGSLTQKLLIE